MHGAGKWVGPVSGMLFTASVVVRFAVSGIVEAEPTDSPDTILALFAEHSESIQVGAIIGMLGLGFLAIFAGHLRNRMSDDGAGWAADAFLAGVVVAVVGWMVVIGAQLTGAVAGDVAHADASLVVADFLWNGSYLATPGLLATGLAAAVAGLVTRAIPVWLAAFAIVVALGALAPWLGVFVFVAWILAASVAEMAHLSRPVTTPAST